MKLQAVHEYCSGCGTCRLACAIENFQAVNPSRSLLRIEARFPAPGTYRIHLCDQCGICADNCPENAIRLTDGVFLVNPDDCTGCRVCVEVCPQNVMFVQSDSEVPVKCTLCGECAHTCPRKAIILAENTKSEMA